MTILAEIERIKKAKTSIRKAIQQNGISMPNSTVFGDYDEYISRMSVEEETVNSTGFKEYTEDYWTSFNIPSDITSIRNQAFRHWTNLKVINILNNEILSLNGLKAFPEDLQYITVPSELVSDYKTATNWSQFADKITAPNYILNSDTMMDKAGTSNNSNGCTFVKTFETDSTAPAGTQLKVTMTNSATSQKGSTGIYIPYTTQLGVTNVSQLQQQMIVGQTYTYSFWAKVASDNTATLTFVPSSVCESQTLVSHTCTALTTTWQRQTVTFTYKSNTKLTTCFYVTIPASSTQTYYICGLQLEPGAVANDYVSLTVPKPTHLIENFDRIKTVSWIGSLALKDFKDKR